MHAIQAVHCCGKSSAAKGVGNLTYLQYNSSGRSSPLFLFALLVAAAHLRDINQDPHIASPHPLSRVCNEAVTFTLTRRFQGVDSVSKVYLSPDNAKSRQEFDQLWNTISGGVETVPVNLR